MRDFRDAKGMARTLRERLAGKHCVLSHSESLELVAGVLGLPNWNVLAARIDAAEREHILSSEPAKAAADAARTQAISPFFIVTDVTETIAFYGERLGFSVGFRAPDEEPFFGVIHRDGAQIFLKSEQGVAPVPNNRRHGHLRWDGYVYSPDPDALHADFSARGASFSQPLRDTDDGLRGFEVTDPDGYVLFFGRPR